MDTTTRIINWDSIYVSVFPRISSKITSGSTYAQRKQDYNVIGLRVAPKRNLESCCTNPCRTHTVGVAPIYIG